MPMLIDQLPRNGLFLWGRYSLEDGARRPFHRCAFHSLHLSPQAKLWAEHFAAWLAPGFWLSEWTPTLIDRRE